KPKAGRSTLENAELPRSPSDRHPIDPWEASETQLMPKPTKQVLEVPLYKYRPGWVIKVRSTLPEND
ncbi:hypothetical protein GW17_00058909, partial [Ensete ventricosum]